ncbi:MAG: 50S ribosomal protein L24 [Mariprofundaceae bacterium]
MSSLVKTRIRRDDDVVVTAGKDRGARGKVIRVLPEKGRILVAKVNLVKRHTRASEQGSGGIIEREAPLSISNVQYYCPNCKSGVRLGAKLLEDGRKVRHCRKCSEVLDS